MWGREGGKVGQPVTSALLTGWERDRGRARGSAQEAKLALVGRSDAGENNKVWKADWEACCEVVLERIVLKFGVRFGVALVFASAKANRQT